MLPWFLASSGSFCPSLALVGVLAFFLKRRKSQRIRESWDAEEGGDAAHHPAG
jgi:hypothetical protein